ncbi:MAG: WD40 repeat domain-containing protein [Solirubrobacterales bacterium]
MNEDRLRELLRDRPIPDEEAAEERAWRVVRVAFEERDRKPAPAVHRRRARLVLALAAALVLAAALALTPAGAKVGDLISDVVDPGRERAEPVLTELPTGGRLLVESSRGPWIVQPDGSKRLLGDYDYATWSPSGLFVAVTRGHELIAVVGDQSAVGEPAGTVRWSLARPQRVRDPVWVGPQVATRIAYRSGDSLRVVAGDGTDDRLLDPRVSDTSPAWKPGGRHLLSYADRNGRVRLVNADSGRELWASGRITTDIENLAWSPDGQSLLVLTSSFFVLLDESGRSIAKGPTGEAAEAAAFSPRSGRIALVRRSAGKAPTGRSELVLLGPDGFGERRLFNGPGRFTDVTWSPDGEWLLLSWKEADQWLFIRPSDERVVAVSNISRQFDPGASEPAPFPRVAGWCCSP